MTSGKPYQGFPYVNRVVTEAPSLTPSQVADLNRWRNLPTRKITTQPLGQRPRDQDLPKPYIDPKTDASKDNLYPHYPNTKRKPKQNDQEREPEPVIYIDLPEDSFSRSSVTEGANNTTEINIKTEVNNTSGINSTNEFNNRSEENCEAGVSSASGSYDINEGSSGVNINTSDWQLVGENSKNGANVKSTKESTSSVYEDNDEIEPVIYIDIPESNESNVSQRLEATDSEPDYAEHTIYYNPFKDNKTESREEASTSSQLGRPSQRPWPPSSLDLPSPGPSRPTPNLPTFLSKEAYIYGRPPSPDDDFSLSPIPLNEHREPPPSYEEAARATSQGPEIRPDYLPPRTQVIIHSSDNHVVGQADSHRKCLNCQYCNKQVNTLVVRATGVLTHMFAVLMLICFFPVVICIYLSDAFKYRVHYCPNCNKKIGYEIPFLCQKMEYVYEE